MENRHGLTLQLAYTYSHEIDEVSNDLNTVSNPFNLAYDRGRERSTGVISSMRITSTVFRSLRATETTLERTTLGGWSISGVTVAQTGTPQPITYNGADVLGLGGGTTNRPNLVAPVSYLKKGLVWFNKRSFADPMAPWNGGANDGFGNAGKDAVVLPGLFNTNLSLFKTFPLASREAGQLRSCALRPSTLSTTRSSMPSMRTRRIGNFGQVTGSYDARTLQLGREDQILNVIVPDSFMNGRSALSRAPFFHLTGPAVLTLPSCRAAELWICHGLP